MMAFAVTRANDFLNYLGTQGHIDQGGSETTYGQCMVYLGIRCWRGTGNVSAALINHQISLFNNTSNPNKTPKTGGLYGTINILHPGVKSTAAAWGNDTIANCLSGARALVNAGAMLGFEGQNEPDNAGFSSSEYGSFGSHTVGSDWTPLARFMNALTVAALADSQYSLLPTPVWASSSSGGPERTNVGLQFITIPSSGWTGSWSAGGPGAGKQLCTHCNVHPYVNSFGANGTSWLAANVNQNVSNSDGMRGQYFGTTWQNGYPAYAFNTFPDIPRVTSEFGNPEAGVPGTRNAQFQVVFQLLSHFARGWSYGCIYQLLDGDGGTAGWGLFGSSAAQPKLSAQILHNLTRVIQDIDASAFPLTQLNYTLAGQPANCHEILVQTSPTAALTTAQNSYFIIIWDDVYDGSNNTVTITGLPTATVANPFKVYDLTAAPPADPGLPTPVTVTSGTSVVFGAGGVATGLQGKVWAVQIPAVVSSSPSITPQIATCTAVASSVIESISKSLIITPAPATSVARSVLVISGQAIPIPITSAIALARSISLSISPFIPLPVALSTAFARAPQVQSSGAVFVNLQSVFAIAIASAVSFPLPPIVGALPRALDFINTIGVVIQPEQGWDMVKGVAQLKYMGVKNIRVQGYVNASAPASFTAANVVTLCQNAGVKAAVFTYGQVPAVLAFAKILANAGVLLAIEGPNEPNNFGLTSETTDATILLAAGDATATWAPVATAQQDLYTGAKADAVLVNYPVWSCTETGAENDNQGLQFLTIPVGAVTLKPVGTTYADVATVHNYVDGSGATPIHVDNQATNASSLLNVSGFDGIFGNFDITWDKGFAGYSPIQLAGINKVTTETGFAIGTSGAGILFSDAIQGKVCLNTFCAQFLNKWSYTFWFYVGLPTPTSGNANDIYHQLYNADYVTPKLAATYLHNFTTLLADQGVFTTVPFSYSLVSPPSTIHSFVVQKASGALDIVVWGESAAGTVTNLQVNFGTVLVPLTFKQVLVFDPTQGTDAIQAPLANVSTVTVAVSDHPVIIELSNPNVLAAKRTIYCKNQTLAALNFGIAFDGNPSTDGVITTGWTVGAAAGQFAALKYGTQQPASAFQATTTLVSAPTPTNADAWTTPFYRGTFLAGNWNIVFKVRPSVAANSQTGHLQARIWASVHQSGGSSRELTSGPIAGAVTPAMTSITTDYDASITWAAPAIVLNDECLLFQLEWVIDSALTIIGLNQAPTSSSANVANVFIGNTINVPVACTLESLSIYISAVNATTGNVRLALYGTTSPNLWPTTLITQTASSQYIAGWNTFPVTPVVIPAGNYVVAYLVDNNAVAIGSVSATGNTWFTSFTYGAFPATAPAVSGGGVFNSLYASFTTPPAGATSNVNFNLTISSIGTPLFALAPSMVWQIYLPGWVANGAGGYSRRQLVGPGSVANPSAYPVALYRGGTRVRVTFRSDPIHGFACTNASIGISDGSASSNTISTPVELLFGGAHGFSLEGNADSAITSDWTSLTFQPTDTLVITVDDSLNDLCGWQTQFASATSAYRDLAGSATFSYNLATQPASFTGSTSFEAPYFVEAQSDYALAAASASFSVSPAIAVPSAGKKFPIPTGIFAETGKIAAVVDGRQLAGSVGIFAVTPKTIQTTIARKLIEPTGLYAFSGTAIPSAGRKFPAALGSFVLNGFSNTMLPMFFKTIVVVPGRILTDDVGNAITDASGNVLYDLTAVTSITLPSDWNIQNNRLHCIGAGEIGGAGIVGTGGTGGRSGCFARKLNFNMPAGSVVPIHIGVPGDPDTWFNDTATLVAKGAQTTTTGCIGDLLFAGAAGAVGNASIGGGGGGAPGSHGAGLPGAGLTGGAPDASFANASMQWTDSLTGFHAGPGQGGPGVNGALRGLAGGPYGSGGGGGGPGTTLGGQGQPGVIMIRYSPPVAGTFYSLPGGAVTGSFNVTGKVSTMVWVRQLAALKGIFVETGSAVAAKLGWKLVANSVGFAIAGKNITIGFGLNENTGAFSVQGTAVRVGFGLLESTASFQLLPKSLAFRVQRGFAAPVGLFGLNGSGTLLNRARNLAEATGSYAISGKNISFGFGLINTRGVFALNLNLGVSFIAGHSKSITTTAGIFSLIGKTVNTSHGLGLAANRINLVLQGKLAKVAVGYGFRANTGIFALTGHSLTFPSFGLVLQTGKFFVNGASAFSGNIYNLDVLSGFFNFSGIDIETRRAVNLIGTEGLV